MVYEDADLTLLSALNFKKSGKMLKGNLISGAVSILDGNIENLSVTVNKGASDEQSLEISFAEINNGGQFETENDGEVFGGIITNNGKAGYQVRFANGPLAETILSFVTEAEFRRIKDQERAREKISEESQTSDGDEQKEEDRLVPDEASEKDLVQIIEKSGFDFSGNKPSRSIASE